MVAHDFDQWGAVGHLMFGHEGWGRFDLGFIPGPRYQALADQAVVAGFAMPRHGVHTIGWPKSDRALRQDSEFRDAVEGTRCSLDIGDRPLVLLACSWSTRQQLIDLVAAVGADDVDIVVRYPDSAPPTVPSPWFDALNEAYDELQDAVAFATSNGRVITTGPEIDLYNLLYLADVVISNGSNVAYEAIVMGTPAVSVSTWPHRAGEAGFDRVSGEISLGGVATVTGDQLGDMIRTLLVNDVSEFIDAGRAELIPVESLGRASQLAADCFDRAIERDREVPLLREQLVRAQAALVAARSQLNRLR